MRKLFVGFEDFIDAKALGSQELMINVLRSHLAEGGIVIMEHRSENAPPKIVNIFNSVDELDSWLKR